MYSDILIAHDKIISNGITRSLIQLYKTHPIEVSSKYKEILEILVSRGDVIIEDVKVLNSFSYAIYIATSKFNGPTYKKIISHLSICFELVNFDILENMDGKNES